MKTLPQRILDYLRDIAPKGASDTQIRAKLKVGYHQQVNQACNRLVEHGKIDRKKSQGVYQNCFRLQPEPIAAHDGNFEPPPRVPRATSSPAPQDGPISVSVLGHVFRIIGELNPRAPDGTLPAYYPQPQYLNAHNLPLNQYGDGAFCRFRIPLKLGRGVYVITLNRTPVYVGETVALSTRFNTGYGQISPRNCFRNGQETNCRINKKVLEAVMNRKCVELWFLDTDDHKGIEAELLRQPMWPWNRR